MIEISHCVSICRYAMLVDLLLVYRDQRGYGGAGSGPSDGATADPGTVGFCVPAGNAAMFNLQRLRAYSLRGAKVRRHVLESK
jgi:hypothetical protein